MTDITLRPKPPARRATLLVARLLAVLAALSLAAVLSGVLPVQGQQSSVPDKPTGVVATATHDSVALAWDDPGDSSITHYQVFRRDRDVHDAGEFVTIEENTGSAAASYTDDTVEPEGSYVYRVKAVNAHGASNWSDYRRADTPAAPDPADLAPSGLEASLVENRVTLTWDAPARDAASVTGYEILRRRPKEGEVALTTLVADTGNAETGYTDDTANEPGVRYAYRVKALRDGEQSRVSNFARIDLPDDYAQDTSGSDRPIPTPEALAPSGLTAEAANGGGVALSWTAPAEDAGSITGYEVLRAQGTAELTTLEADTGSTDTAHTDGTATAAGETYAYQVKALQGGEKSQVSNQATITLPDGKSGQESGNQARADEEVLVSNTGKSHGGYITITSATSKRAQAFTTGTNELGYTLSSIGIYFGTISSNSKPTSELTATLNKVDGSNPGDVVCTLTDPASYVAHSVNTYQAPASGCPTLTASTTYFFVLSRANDTVQTIQLDRTNSSSEDADPAAGWSIADSRRFFTSAWSSPSTPTAHRIAVTGAVATAGPATELGPTEVPLNWSLKPSGLGVGDEFRLLFVSSTTRNAASTDIATYNTWIQNRAAAGHADIRDYSDTFRVVGSTAAVDARDNTETAYTSSDKGVPIYWLGGNKVADQYEDFYDGGWDEEVNRKDEDGNASSLTQIWTGSNDSGTEAFAGTTSRALGKEIVAQGSLNHATLGPVGNSAANGGKNSSRPFYGLSAVLRVVPTPPTVVPADWSLIPSGLSHGAEFRLLFLSSTKRSIRSTNISNYNTFVRNRAAAGHTDIQDYSDSFRVLGSTSAVAARDNTETTYTSSDKGVRIYWLNGDKAADQYQDFYDDSWDQQDDAWNESGVEQNLTAPRYVATGTKEGGNKDVDHPLRASSGETRIGCLNDSRTSNGPIECNLVTEDIPGDDNQRLYGLSGVFQVDPGDPDTLVSNLGQTASATGASVSTTKSVAQGFTTGANSRGYTLGSVVLAVTLPGGVGTGTASDLTVSIYSESSGNPGTLVHTLTTPAILSDPVTTLTAPSDATLDAGTTYYVVAASTSTLFSLGRTEAAAEDSGGASGWSIADDRRSKISLSWTTAPVPFRMRINGAAVETPATGKPVISGTPEVNQTLTADDQFSYQWIRNDGTDSDISGATDSSYKLKAADLGKTIKVRVSFTDEGGNEQTLTSDATTAVAADATGPVPTGAQVLTIGHQIYIIFDETFLHNLDRWPPKSAFTVEADGAEVVVGGVFVNNVDISGSVLGQVLLSGLSPVIYQGQTVTVTYTEPSSGDDTNAIQDEAGNDAASFTTGEGDVPAVTNDSTVATVAPGAPTGLTATANGATQIDLTWTAPADNGGRVIEGYQIEYSDDAGMSWSVLVADTQSTDTMYSDTTLSGGETRHYRVSAINSIGTGEASNSPPTGKPVITGTPEVKHTLTADVSDIMGRGRPARCRPVLLPVDSQ